MAALAGLPLDRLAAALPEPPPPGIGSNVWVADGSRTASGRPLLANDPHLQLQMPGHWYLAQLEAPGLAVIGATLPGAAVRGARPQPRPRLGLHQHRLGHAGSVRRAARSRRPRPLPDAGRQRSRSGARSETILVRGGASRAPRGARDAARAGDLRPRARRPAPPARDRHVLALAWTQLQDRHRHHDDGRLRPRPGARRPRPSWPRPSSIRAPSRTWPSPRARAASA